MWSWIFTHWTRDEAFLLFNLNSLFIFSQRKIPALDVFTMGNLLAVPCWNLESSQTLIDESPLTKSGGSYGSSLFKACSRTGIPSLKLASAMRKWNRWCFLISILPAVIVVWPLTQFNTSFHESCIHFTIKLLLESYQILIPWGLHFPYFQFYWLL